jgi:hypothetical protein
LILTVIVAGGLAGGSSDWADVGEFSRIDFSRSSFLVHKAGWGELIQGGFNRFPQNHPGNKLADDRNGGNR